MNPLVGRSVSTLAYRKYDLERFALFTLHSNSIINRFLAFHLFATPLMAFIGIAFATVLSVHKLSPH